MDVSTRQDYKIISLRFRKVSSSLKVWALLIHVVAADEWSPQCSSWAKASGHCDRSDLPLLSLLPNKTNLLPPRKTFKLRSGDLFWRIFNILPHLFSSTSYESQRCLAISCPARIGLDLGHWLGLLNAFLFFFFLFSPKSYCGCLPARILYLTSRLSSIQETNVPYFSYRVYCPSIRKCVKALSSSSIKLRIPSQVHEIVIESLLRSINSSRYFWIWLFIVNNVINYETNY